MKSNTRSVSRLVVVLGGAAAVVLAVSSCAGSPGPAAESGGPITFASNGGALQEAQSAAYIDAFLADNPQYEVLEDTGSTDYAKFQAQVESGNVLWDVADIGGDFGAHDPAAYFEPIDCAVVECPADGDGYRIPTHQYGAILAYNPDAVDTAPTGWEDFFDLEKFPGKRAIFQLAAATGIFEAALLADGVAPEDLYPLDYERALAKYDTIKSEIVWAPSPTDAARLVADGEAVMGNVFSSQAYNMSKNGSPVEIVWEGVGLGIDYLVIPKGARNVEGANALIGFITSAEHNHRMSEIYPVAPGNPDAVVSEDAETYPFLPTADKADESYIFDGPWYAENLDAYTERFTAWLQE
ncbi:extracellular solute-binding protein [Agromyces silvae]|uniref:extracellular solute-binding protein n=1 Tax=Agromyces silvae TaxID=3388266 RepID=UPI00280BA84A|nr:extracellular solute-binding protein [Agromyces protaetiae]